MAPFKKMLSSEIARLVYGYLSECGVSEQISYTFLRESPYLAECRELQDEGDAFHTDFKGLSLKEVLQEYSLIHHIVDSKVKSSSVSERLELESRGLSDKLCVLFNVPERPRSRTSSFLGTRASYFDYAESQPSTKDSRSENEPIVIELIEANDGLNSSGSYGIPETPGNSLTIELTDKNQLTADNNRTTDNNFVKKSLTLSRSFSFNDLSSVHDKRKPKTRPKFFTPNKRLSDEPPKEMIIKTLKELYEDKALHEKIARNINEVREGITDTTPSDLDDAIKTIMEKTTADPSFNQIMEQTLTNFDLMDYLKPVTTPVAASKSQPEPAAKNSHKLKNLVAPLIMPPSVGSNVITAEFQSYPEIRYDPVDCNILTGALDTHGNYIFYSNPPKRSILALSPAPVPRTRQRSILPKFPKAPLMNLNPVIVCTPLMPPPEANKPKLPVRRVAKKKLPKTKETLEPITEEPAKPETLELREGTLTVNDGILPSLLATPGQTEAPNKPLISNTPRKSYIRTLEFPTPLKETATAAETEKPSWDSTLRAQLSELEKTEKPSPRKGKREKKVKKKPVRKKKQETASPRLTRSRKITISPSKNNLTAKRNTYAISHGSSSAFESSSSADEATTLSNLVEMTPAKEDEVNQEETPFTKLLRENVSCVDIDLSMIPTPVFPATPCIETATPVHAGRNTDYSSGSSYYKPEMTSPGSCFNERQEEHVQDVTTPSGTNLVVSPDQLQINQLVNEGKKILGHSSGKNMSFFKLQMIANCDLKLSENIPINETLKDELERKRKNTLEKLKTTQKKTQPQKRKIKEPVVSSTPNKTKRMSAEMSNDVKKEIPSFVDDGQFPELNLVTRKKFFVVGEILKRAEVVDYLKNYSSVEQTKISLKPCIRKLFKTLFRWLKHPHKHELDVARQTIDNYLQDFRKINQGIQYKKKSSLSNLYDEYKKSGRDCPSSDGSSIDSDVAKKWNNAKRKTDATLPLKKRKKKNSPLNASGQSTEKNVSQAQKILKHIDVDRFLSRVHGQENS